MTGFPNDPTYRNPNPKETTMTPDLERLANQITRRANGIFAGTEHETYAYSAAAELEREHGITEFIVRPGRTLDIVDQVIRNNTSFPDNEDLDEEDTNVSVWEDAHGIHLATAERTITLDLPGALDAVTLLTSAINGTLRRPYSADDPSTILSRGTRTEAQS